MISAFERLEVQKQAVLSDIGSWPSEQARQRPREGAWSALEVLDHLVKVERSALIAIRRELAHGHRVGLKDRVGAWVVIATMRSPMRVKVPAGVSAVLPAAEVDFADIARRWSAVREGMAELLRSLEPHQLRAGLFQHPGAGWMTISQALTFFSVHIRHHEYQLKRLRSGAFKI